jgi:K+-sensing histidine kinase KdpD
MLSTCRSLIPVLISGIVFGFATSLFAVVISIVAADFFFAPPEFDFSITEWEDVLGLAVFGVIGSFAALMIDDFLSFPE